MSTTIKCAATDATATLGPLLGYTEPRIYIRIDDDEFVTVINPTRVEFLAAIAAELDVIVIPRSDLPEVTVSPGGRIQARGATLLHGTATGSDALGWLAIEEHLEKNPPIDEAAVDALAKVCMAEGVADPHRTARRLVAAGVRAPQAGDQQ